MRALDNRIPPPVIALFCALLMYGIARITPIVEIAGSLRVIGTVVLLLAGAAIAAAGGIAFRRAKTTVNPLTPEKASALVSGGIYRFTRNPMYLGFALLLVAWALYLGSPAALLVGLPAFVGYLNRFQIAPEERALEKLFGAEFTGYRQQVRRWL